MHADRLLDPLPLPWAVTRLLRMVVLASLGSDTPTSLCPLGTCSWLQEAPLWGPEPSLQNRFKLVYPDVPRLQLEFLALVPSLAAAALHLEQLLCMGRDSTCSKPMLRDELEGIWSRPKSESHPASCFCLVYVVWATDNQQQLQL